MNAVRFIAEIVSYEKGKKIFRLKRRLFILVMANEGFSALDEQD
jgi:hypothetical protein